MISFFKGMRGDIQAVEQKLDDLKESLERTDEPLSVQLMRRLLGSIDREGVKAENREALVTQVGPIADLLIEHCERFISRQERFTASESRDWGQALFGRGSINGIQLFKEELEVLKSEWVKKNEQPEPFDPHSTLPS